MVLRKWLPALIWMALIFAGSTDLLSGEHTGRVIVPFLRWISGDHLTPEEVRDLHLVIRKCGHLTEYAILSVLFWFALGRPHLDPNIDADNRGPWLAVFLAVTLSVSYAALDEYHQSYTPSRTASWHDVAIDGAGAIAGLTIVALLRLGHSRRRKPTLAA